MDEKSALTSPHALAPDHTPAERRPTVNPPLHPVNTDSPFKKLASGKHRRYLSDFADNIIQINVDRPKPLVFDLSTIMLPANAAVGGRRKIPFPLLEVPNWVNAIKACINQWLHDLSATSLYGELPKRLDHLLHFIEFCVLNVRYSFLAATPEDIEKLINGFRAAGWYSALDIESAFRRFIDACTKDKKLLDECITRDPAKKRFYLKYGPISRWLGIQVGRTLVPPFVYQYLATLTGLSSNVKELNANKPKSVRYYESMLPVLNTAFELPDAFDRLRFCPFPPAQIKATAALIGNPMGRTENLSLDDAIRILKVGLDGLYDWSRGVIEIGRELRQLMENLLAAGEKEYAIADRMNERLRAIYPGYKKKYRLPFEQLSCVTKKDRSSRDKAQSPSFNDMVHLIMTCCMVMAGMNHGRRKNEIIGEGYLPYGLYFGCVKTVNGELQQYRLDIYVEKTVMDWAEFWCNKLVKDAVGVLEELHQLFRPLGTPRIEGKYQSRDLDHKLFTYRLLCPSGFKDAPASFLMFLHSKQFFDLANVERKVLDQKTHVFRRFFALIYYYRYDHRSLQALSHHLRHLNQESTRVYIEDPVSRDEKDRIQALYLRAVGENAEQDAVDAEVRSEKFLDSIKHIIAGNPASGGFAKHVLRVYTYCARTVDFSTLDEEQQAIRIRDRFESKGYAPNPMRHGECEAGASRSRARGKCYDAANGRLHRENASAELCNRCMFHFSGPNYLANLEADLPNLAERAENRDGDYDLAEQAAAAEAYDNLFSLLEGLREEQQRVAEKAQSARAAVIAEKEDNHADQ